MGGRGHRDHARVVPRNEGRTRMLAFAGAPVRVRALISLECTGHIGWNAITLDGEVCGKQAHVSNAIHVVLGIKVPRHGRREVPSPRQGQRCSQ